MIKYKHRLNRVGNDIELLMHNIIDEIGDLNDNLPENKELYDLLVAVTDMYVVYELSTEDWNYV